MAQMLFGRFWLQNKDLSPSVGAIDIIFRAGSVPMGPGGWGVGPRCAPLEIQGEGGPGGSWRSPPPPRRWETTRTYTTTTCDTLAGQRRPVSQVVVVYVPPFLILHSVSMA